MYDVILASHSPRRKMLLEWAEVSFEIIVKHIDEDFPSGLTMTDTAIHIARNKALSVQEHVQEAFHGRFSEKTILAADTMVVLGEEILGKPGNRDEAISMLKSLSGKKHTVITGVVILHEKGEIAFAESTEVKFHNLSEEQIVFYVDKFEPYDKAGGYAIQEWIGVVGIESIKGDFYNVMGLPVSRVLQALDTLKK